MTLKIWVQGGGGYTTIALRLRSVDLSTDPRVDRTARIIDAARRSQPQPDSTERPSEHSHDVDMGRLWRPSECLLGSVDTR